VANVVQDFIAEFQTETFQRRLVELYRYRSWKVAAGHGVIFTF